jgi:hypothetical protein
LTTADHQANFGPLFTAARQTAARHQQATKQKRNPKTKRFRNPTMAEVRQQSTRLRDGNGSRV